MARLRTHLLTLPFVALVLTTAACANTPTVRVCDPCGCRCVAAPLVTGCGEVPRTAETSDADVPSPKGAAPAKPALDPTSDAAVEQVLAKKRIRGLVWEETNLDTAVAYLRTVTGLTFTITPKVREEQFEDILYNLNLEEVSAKDVLDVITEPFGLRWEPRLGVVWILTREEIGGHKRRRTFDVKDLVRKVGTPGAKVSGPGGAGFNGGEELLEAIRLEVHPTYWDEQDVALEARKGILIVRASLAVLDSVDDFLSHERRKRNPAGLSAEWKKRTEATLINLSVENTRLADVIKTLQIQTGMNLTIDPRIVSDVARNPITGLQLSEATLATALAMLTAAAGEDTLWISRGQILILTRKELLDGQ